MQKYFLLILVPFVFALLSCEGDILPPRKSSLVVEGYIEAGGHPVVMLSSTIPVSKDITPLDSIGQYVVRWAHVTITDGQRTVALSAKYDAGYFPPYIYTSTAIVGEVGRTYKLEVDYEDVHASAVTSVPAPIPLERVYAVLVNEEDSLFAVHAVFNHDASRQRYCKLFTRIAGKSKQYLSSFMGILDCTILSNPADVPVYKGLSVVNPEYYDTSFHSGDEVWVKLCAVDPIAYRYWYDWSQNENFSNNPVIPSSANLPSNVHGAMGYWFGYGSSTKAIRVGTYEVPSGK